MLPQTGTGHQLRHQQSGLSNFPGTNQSFDATSQGGFFNMDPAQAAKQMAALNAAGQARLATNSRVPPSSSGTNSASSYLSGLNPANYPDMLNHPANYHPMASSSNPNVNTPFDPTMAQSNSTQQAAQVKQKQHFLGVLANVMAKRNTPLPPALTGIPAPNYDPTNSPWRLIEPSSEVGAFRLAGKDVSLFRLWGVVQQNGGGQAITSRNGWGIIAALLELPEEFPQPQPNGSSSVANTLCQYYMAILSHFDELYKRDHQRRMHVGPRPPGPSFQGGQAAAGPATQGRPIPGMAQTGQMPRPSGNAMATMHVPGNPGGQLSQMSPHVPMASSQKPSSAAPFSSQSNPSSSATPSDTIPPTLQSDTALELGESLLDQDVQGIKRKMEFEDAHNKRARQKTEPLESNPVPPTTAASSSSVDPNQKLSSTSIVAQAGQPMRRKIEYVPLAREVDTYGGRDLKAIEAEYANLASRPLRDVNDWGIVDIETLTMSLRSRLAAELSYALTTLTLLSTMRGQSQGTGFPILQSVDLFEEVLDLLEETAFGNVEDSTSTQLQDDSSLLTNKELVNTIIEEASGPFAVPKESQFGPRQRPANVILVISNVLRNFSLIFDNAKYMSQHDRVLPILFRLCSAAREERKIRPASPALSLGDLVAVRKDVLYTMINIVPFWELAQNARSPPATLTLAKRAFDLVSSFLVDPLEAISPYSLVQLNGSLKPPSMADAALEVFTRMSQTDSNRQVIAQAVSQAAIKQLFESLVHRLPVVDADFQLFARDIWIAYIEKTLMAIYSLAFLAPPCLKQALKKDRNLGFRGVMVRMVRKFLSYPEHKSFMVAARRAVEAMKVLDDGEDTFDTDQSTTATLAFGMGYGEGGDSGTERGTGLLGGHRDMAWDMLMHREVLNDVVMFGELESLARVECA